MKIKLEGIIRTMEQYTDAQLKELTNEMTSHRVWLNEQELNLEKSLKLSNHSLNGFNWGYGGSGPSQLALAVCLELFGEYRARVVYQDFKRELISRLPIDQDFAVEMDLTEFIKAHQDDFVKADQQQVEEQHWQEKLMRMAEEEREYLEQHPEETIASNHSGNKLDQPDMVERLSQISPVRFSYRVPNRPEAYCDLVVSKEHNLIIASEVADNPGLSITNAAEYVATQACEAFGIQPKKLIWIEHYSNRSYPGGRTLEDFDLVTFRIDGEGKFSDPEWRSLEKGEVEDFLKVI
jgi:hypothetical protein